MGNPLVTIIHEALLKSLQLPAVTTISMTSNLKEDLGLDSMSLLTFLMMLEENIPNFTVEPENLEMQDLLTVQSVLAYVERQLCESKKNV